MQVLSIAFSVVFVVMAAIFALGWLVPLVMGIVRLRRKREGTALTIIGGVWGILALLMVGFAAYGYFSVSRVTEPSSVADFTPATCKGPTGKIVLPYKGEVSLVVSPLDADKQLRLSGKNGELVAPAGIHRLSEFEAVARDSRNVKWTASCSFWSGKQREICVRAGGSTPLDVGPPLTARVVAQHSGPDHARFDLEVLGPGGGSYSIEAAGGRDAPRFVVLSPSGEVLWKGKFEAG